MHFSLVVHSYCTLIDFEFAFLRILNMFNVIKSKLPFTVWYLADTKWQI
uniref:Uncharacterized protein n=1 Tax=Anguilla anguilla TaxID=7936 RepID=A0A0E9WRP4_ANGAN